MTAMGWVLSADAGFSLRFLLGLCVVFTLGVSLGLFPFRSFRFGRSGVVEEGSVRVAKRAHRRYPLLSASACTGVKA